MEKIAIEMKVGKKISDINCQIINQVLSQGITDLTPFINQVKNNKMSKNIGHNSKHTNQNTSELLKQYIEGIENYNDRIKEMQGSIKEIFDEAKSTGFNPKIMRKIISMRKLDQAKLDEQEYLLETYKEALGMTEPDLFNQPIEEDEKNK
jgi:uncharacterized protein (UPF0335 family)